VGPALRSSPQEANRSMRSRDGKPISLTEEQEAQYWTEVLGISRVRLEAEIKKHGNSAWLRKYRPPLARPYRPPRFSESRPAGREMDAEQAPEPAATLQTPSGSGPET
jgi:Protein of unknown function (DUF3606)